MAKDIDPFQKIAEQISSDKDADTLVYIGSVNIPAARRLVNLVNGRKCRRKNLFFVLGTNGGDAHAAYKIARCLQHAYEGGDFVVAVYGDCKSAGTLIAIAAQSVVMCQHGELGPLDVQMKKDDQLFVRSSGLTTSQALESLKKEAFSQFEHFLLEVHDRTGYEISTKLATSMAIRLVTGLLGPIYQQIDPMRIGETQRAMDVANAYGERLNTTRNLKEGALKKLIEGYPAHDFAIDFDEATKLFERITKTDPLQRSLGDALAHHLLDYEAIANRRVILAYLNQEPEPSEEKKEKKNAAERNPHAGTHKPASTSTGESGSEASEPNGRGREAPESGAEHGTQATVQITRTRAKSAPNGAAP